MKDRWVYGGRLGVCPILLRQFTYYREENFIVGLTREKRTTDRNAKQNEIESTSYYVSKQKPKAKSIYNVIYKDTQDQLARQGTYLLLR